MGKNIFLFIVFLLIIGVVGYLLFSPSPIIEIAKEEFNVNDVKLWDYYDDNDKNCFVLIIYDRDSLVNNINLKNESGHFARIIKEMVKELDDYDTIEVNFATSSEENTILHIDNSGDTMLVNSVSYSFPIKDL